MITRRFLLQSSAASTVYLASGRRSARAATAPGGMLTFTDDEFKAGIEQETGIKPPWAAEAFGELDDDVRQSIRRIKASPFVPYTDAVRGFVFDVATGKLNEVI